MVAFFAVGFLATGCENSTPQNIDVTVAIKDMKMAPNEINVNQNDTLVMAISSDTSGTLHIHGYDLTQILQKNAGSTLQFEASATGMFKIAFHKAESEDSHQAHSDQKSNDHDHNHRDHKMEEIILGSLKVNPR